MARRKLGGSPPCATFPPGICPPDRSRVAYKACFQCELLFEVDEESAGRGMSCPQCGGPLDDYAAAGDEVGHEAPEPAETVALPQEAAESGIVSTRAFDGLAAAVREQLEARKSRREAAEAAPDPAPAERPVAAAVGPPPGGSYGTKILDLSSAEAGGAAGDPIGPGEVLEPTAMLGKDLSAAVRAAERPLPAEPPPPVAEETPKPKRRYGAPPGSEDQARRTMVADVDELEGRTPAPKGGPAAPRGGASATASGPPADARRSAPQPRPRSSGGAGRVVLIVLLLVVVGAGGGAALWWFVLREKPQTVAKPDDAAPVREPDFDEKLGRMLEDGQAVLPVVTTELTLAESPFIAGGPEGLSTSAGVIPGLPSVKINEPLVESDGGGEWVSTLKTALDPASGDGSARLALALDGSVPLKTITRLAYSGFKAGFRKFALVVGRGNGAPGERGLLPFTLQLPETKAPAPAAVVIRIGSRGMLVAVQGPDGNDLDPAERANIPRREKDNGLDLTILGEKLDALSAAHADVKAAIIYANDDLKLEQLAQIVAIVRNGAEKARFPEVALSTR